MDPPVSWLPDLPHGKGAASSHWCAPYAYKQREGLPCGGADKWSIVPVSSQLLAELAFCPKLQSAEII